MLGAVGLALLIYTVVTLNEVGRRFVRGDPPPTLQDLTRDLNVPMHSVRTVLDALAQGGILRRTNDAPPALIPARERAQLRVADVLAKVRAAGEAEFLGADALLLPQHVEAVAASVERAIASSSATSVRSMIDAAGAAWPVAGEPDPAGSAALTLRRNEAERAPTA